MNETRKATNELHAKSILPLFAVESYINSLCEIACECLREKGSEATCSMVERWGREAKLSLANSIQNTENVIAKLRAL